MKDKTKKKRDREQRVVEEMILLYCRAHHHDAPCARCQELIDYARMRTRKCPFMETKTFCSNCRVHCYDRVHREQIRSVMRYSGKRMLVPSSAACPGPSRICCRQRGKRTD